MTLKGNMIILGICTAALLAASPVRAQVATTLEQAELAGLKPDVRAEVQKRLGVGGRP